MVLTLIYVLFLFPNPVKYWAYQMIYVTSYVCTHMSASQLGHIFLSPIYLKLNLPPSRASTVGRKGERVSHSVSRQHSTVHTGRRHSFTVCYGWPTHGGRLVFTLNPWTFWWRPSLHTNNTTNGNIEWWKQPSEVKMAWVWCWEWW